MAVGLRWDIEAAGGWVTQPVVVDLPAPPRERGEAHGEQLRSAVRDAVARWKDSLAATEGGDPDEWIRAFLAGTDFMPAIEDARAVAAGRGARARRRGAGSRSRTPSRSSSWTSSGAGPPEGGPSTSTAARWACSPRGRRRSSRRTSTCPSGGRGCRRSCGTRPSRTTPARVLVTAAGFIVMNGMNARRRGDRRERASGRAVGGARACPSPS